MAAAGFILVGDITGVMVSIRELKRQERTTKQISHHIM
jgi:hypothetical protein